MRQCCKQSGWHEKLHTSASGSGRHGATACDKCRCLMQQKRAKSAYDTWPNWLDSVPPPPRTPAASALAIWAHLLHGQRLRLIGRVGLVVQIQESRPAALELALPRAAHGLALRVRHDDVQEMEDRPYSRGASRA